MNQRELHRAVAKATGETVAEIDRRGFQPFIPDAVDPQFEDQIVDWDELALDRTVAVVPSRQPRAVA